MQKRQFHPSFSQFLTNLDVPMPFWTKVRLVVRNASLRIVKKQNCCGHPGEPGC